MCVFFNDAATSEIYTLSLHDALPISEDGFASGISSRATPPLRGEAAELGSFASAAADLASPFGLAGAGAGVGAAAGSDRKSTRLNSSHANISYAVFCLKKTQTASAPL